MRKYIAITPARDEEKLLPGLIASMTSQTCRPGRWIVIDDGSTDSTAQIVTDAAKTWPWIELHRLSHRRERTAGGESVVMQFLPRNEIERYDFILRADADVSFDSDFAALLIGEFENDPGLGIGGPVLLEPFGSGWRELSGPGFHVPGGLKMYSVACFAAICGLTSGLGWDTIDLMSAQMRGYRTRKFAHIRALHHRPQGAASGMWRNRLAQGYAAFHTGSSPLWMLARTARHLAASPPVVGALLMLAGYCGGYLRRLPRAASPELVSFVRRQQMRRLLLRDTVWR